MFGRQARKFAVAAAVLMGLLATSAPAMAASSDGADVFHQSVCLPSGTSTVCIDYHSLINEVTTPSETHVYTQNTRAVVTATSSSGAFLYSFEQGFKNTYVYSRGEFQTITAQFKFVTKVPGFGTCTQQSDIVFANGEVRFTNVSYVCR